MTSSDAIQQRGERLASAGELHAAQFDLSSRAFEALPYVTSSNLAWVLGMHSQSGARRWAQRAGIVPVVRGGIAWYDLRDVRAFVEHAPSSRRRAA